MIFEMWGPSRDSKRTLSQGDKSQLMQSAGHRCEACKMRGKLTSGHIKAHSKGGKTSLKNSVALCMECNSNMRNKSYKAYMKEMGWRIPKSVTLRTGLENPSPAKKTATKKTTAKKKVVKKKPVAKKAVKKTTVKKKVPVNKKPTAAKKPVKRTASKKNVAKKKTTTKTKRKATRK